MHHCIPNLVQACGDSFASAFAALLGDGSVITWGDADYGGDTLLNLETL